MTFISSARRLLAPIKQAKFETFLQTIYYASRPLSGMISVYILKLITESIQQGSQSNLKGNIIFFGCFIVLYNIWLYIGRKRTRVKMTETYLQIIQTEYINHFLKLDNNYTDKKGTGYLISVFEKGMYQRSESIQSMCRYTSIFFVSIGFIIYSFYQLPLLLNMGLIVVLMICVSVVIYLSNKLKYLRATENELYNHRSKDMVKIIMSKMEIIQNNQGNKQIVQINDISKRIIASKKNRSNYIYFMYNLPEILISLIQFVVFGIIGYGILQGAYQLGDLVLLGGSIAIVSTTLSEFTTFYKDFFKDFGKVEQLWKLIDDGGMIEYSTGKDYIHKNGNISFTNVSYSYSPHKPVFHNFNLSIIGGKKTALVGPSGGGKSTLIKLIAGYIRPDVGEISVDEQILPSARHCEEEGSDDVATVGNALGGISLKSYYKHIGYLTQEPSVFDGTIRENLMYGVCDVEQDSKTIQTSLKKIISLSRCEWIHDLPHGLDTEIGEKGVRLSGGQRQRLAIAKIMLKNPDIILLDEPTSALDSENEELVTQALDNLFKGKTVIVVAHRLQTVKHADQILFIDTNPDVGPGGHVIEQGTHTELLGREGKYFKMVELQSGF